MCYREEIGILVHDREKVREIAGNREAGRNPPEGRRKIKRKKKQLVCVGFRREVGEEGSNLAAE